MIEIIALLHGLDQCLDSTTIRRLERIIAALLAMTGRVTMLGIARWTAKGGSYRTIQRWFKTALPWAQIFWLFFRTHVFRPDEVYLVVGDESVVSKAGKQTYGLDRFFSSIYNRPIPGVSFFTLSLVSVSDAVSHPLLTEQVVKPAVTDAPATPKKATSKKATSKKTTPKKTTPKKTTPKKTTPKKTTPKKTAPKKTAPKKTAPKKTAPKKTAPKKTAPKKAKTGGKGKAGRPKGSKNKNKRQVEWNGELKLLERLVKQLLALIGGLFPLTYLVLDGHFGNNNVGQMVRQSLGLHLISKLRHDSALYFQYEGEQKKSGPRRRYGDKLDYQALPERYRMASSQDQQIRTELYQATLLQACFADPLNVVLLVKTNLDTGARAHAVLFSTDLELAAETLVHYYRLRFQIEFNFRDAKQFWGMEDFMTIKATPVTNAVNLALFMVNVSQRLLTDFRSSQPEAGVLDLKAFFRGRKYAQATIELLPEPPAPDIIATIVQYVASMGAIHSTRTGITQP
jgi:putative transposase